MSKPLAGNPYGVPVAETSSGKRCVSCFARLNKQTWRSCLQCQNENRVLSSAALELRAELWAQVEAERANRKKLNKGG